jgi:hypothetical protein
LVCHEDGVLLQDDGVDPTDPLAVEVAKLAVLVAVGMNRLVFLPQEH